jgi:misacylated tRNA(Ala) deacylase
MSTEELFREDAYLRTTTAKVVRADAQGIVLDRSVFYPEGGGQPGDRGELQLDDGTTIVVIDTQKDATGQLIHIPAPDSVAPGTGSQIGATIDWDYRYRHMRTHTCLHLLCALIAHPVTGGSISQDKGRLDFDMSDTIDKASLESALNELVAADHVVDKRWITDDEMQANMALVRTMSVKPPMGAGRVRLIDIAGVDLQPCGGTHIARTSEIGHVRIGKVEKKGKQNRRVAVHLD